MINYSSSEISTSFPLKEFLLHFNFVTDCKRIQSSAMTTCAFYRNLTTEQADRIMTMSECLYIFKQNIPSKKIVI
jgi:hypothetical protein